MIGLDLMKGNNQEIDLSLKKQENFLLWKKGSYKKELLALK